MCVCVFEYVDVHVEVKANNVAMNINDYRLFRFEFLPGLSAMMLVSDLDRVKRA